ncbi:ABC transporter family substrate-binding protein [[Mycobacterium] vasticus]|uniref:ABC transporter family substrate-binding protein n=1 Tax=[Mycobacterium] vasticus TaxID=2875777 RepID=A0ABU5YWQ6_9MYCO|nr:ABC transporter family substrate-binding protein [Mycolicibacter sp. MYC017]MEB3068849.1 ABC transporter family substrate-binding protein [Mycolicibacter sp. MYC017]
MTPKAGAAFAALALTLGLALSGCAAVDITAPEGAATVGSASDVNPQDPASLRDGGNLRLSMNQFPPNFNPLHIDGNLAENAAMLKATMPRAFIISPDGSATVDNDYFTSVELTGTNPQVVTYTINPKAAWSDGTPLSWKDIASQIHATSGADSGFAIATTNGAERVASVTRGVDDRQAVMRFAKPYAEWRGMFAGNSMLLPASMTADAEVFNKGQLRQPGPSAGPFKLATLDRTSQRISLVRNPEWWGKRAKLDTITYLVLDDAARMPALQNHTIDATGVATLDQLTIARRTEGVTIRRAPTPAWNHFTFNGAPGAILSDKALRLAVMRGIDRNTIAKVTQRGLTADPVALNNHIYVAGQEGYQDNSAVVAYDPARAARELDELGWKLNGKFREKDGQPLVIRHLFYDASSTRQFAQVAQHNLAQIGVKLQLDAKAGGGFFTDYVNVGDFDIAQFSWVGDAFPLAGLNQISASYGEANFGKIGSPQIDAKIEETLEALDPAVARARANEVDRLLWEEGFSLPLIQTTGNVAVRSALANFGAPGLADLDYTAIGFMKD